MQIGNNSFKVSKGAFCNQINISSSKLSEDNKDYICQEINRLFLKNCFLICVFLLLHNIELTQIDQNFKLK